MPEHAALVDYPFSGQGRSCFSGAENRYLGVSGGRSFYRTLGQSAPRTGRHSGVSGRKSLGTTHARAGLTMRGAMMHNPRLCLRRLVGSAKAVAFSLVATPFLFILVGLGAG